MLKRIGILIITIISLLGLCGCKDKKFVGDTYEYGDYVYCYVTKAGATKPAVRGDYIAILELTEEGQKKDVIVIPDEIEGKPVIQIGMEGFGYISDFRKGTYTSIYLPKDLKSIGGRGYYNDDVNTIFINYFNIDVCFNYKYDTLYISNEEYDKAYEEKLINEKGEIINETGDITGKLKIANLEFISNNEIYFIANYEQEEKITYIPTNPTKEGYTFEGWYKEEECINKYDFENETFHLEEGEEILRLYAKWV